MIGSPVDLAVRGPRAVVGLELRFLLDGTEAEHPGATHIQPSRRSNRARLRIDAVVEGAAEQLQLPAKSLERLVDVEVRPRDRRAVEVSRLLVVEIAIAADGLEREGAGR
jgi:hypothetical protein